MADDVIVIHRGRLVRQDSIDDLTNGGSALRVATFEPGRLAKALEEDGLSVRHDGEGKLTVRDGSAERVGALAFAAGIPLLELTTVQGTLEDVFLELTNGAEDER